MMMMMFGVYLFVFINFIYVCSSAEDQINVFGKKLEQCSISPMTGYYRTGSCDWDGPGDFGVHSVCAKMTNEFLEFTRSRGNDLSSANPLSGFPGLREGDRWCLCAGRWREAFNAGKAPPVVLRATHQISLQHVKIDDLKRNALGNTSRRRTQSKG